jgi:hypothetical protein
VEVAVTIGGGGHRRWWSPEVAGDVKATKKFKRERVKYKIVNRGERRKKSIIGVKKII